jgi:allantoinase
VFLPDLVVRGRRVVTPRGIRPAAVHIRSGRIIGVVDIDNTPPGCPLDDVGEDAVVLPGLVDTQVRVDESGRTTPEGFERTTRAAASGGVTTIVAVPCGDEPLTSPAAMESACHAAEGHCFVDVGFWAGVVADNERDLAALFQSGALGFTCALSAWEPGGHPAVSEADLRASLPTLTRIGAPLLAHAELPGPIEQAAADPLVQRTWRTWIDRIPGMPRAPCRYSSYLEGRPKAAETEGVALLLQLCQEYRIRTHLVHLSSSDALTPIFHARSSRLPVTAGTCPHYLAFVAEEIPDGAVEYKCAPPIRERTNRELLWAALAGGLIESVASDHRPALPSTRGRDFVRARSGIASVQLGLSSVWTGASAREYTLEQVVRWMCGAPAQLAGLARKGSVDVGYDADLVVFDPDAEFIVEAEARRGHRPSTPYSGRRLRGVVKRTYLRGTCVYGNGNTSPEATGRLLLRRQHS